MTQAAAAVPDTTDYMARLSAARSMFRAFVDQRGRGERLVILHDSDADGVTAGVVLQQALARANYTDLVRVVPDRERNAWTEANRARVREAAPRGLFVLDLGASAEPIIEDVPTCFVDHHRPEGVPPRGDVLISAYDWTPIPNTSLMIYELCRELADISDLLWIACLGTLSDLGERAPFPLIAEAKKLYTAKWLKEATTLVNASRRAARYEPETAARALLAHDHPRAFVESTSPDVESLRAARAEVNAALSEAKKAAPIFSGPVALIRLNSKCQVHPLIAQIWRTRLGPKYIVIAANEGYLPGRVNFSARSSGPTSALDFLKAIPLEGDGGSYAHGHDQASGGSLPVERWNQLLNKLGFPATVRSEHDGSSAS